jgi:hypothetical protein
MLDEQQEWQLYAGVVKDNNMVNFGVQVVQFSWVVPVLYATKPTTLYSRGRTLFRNYLFEQVESDRKDTTVRRME